MADGTKIEWTDATWNVINGCSVTSPGCTNCYAMRLAGTRLRNHPSRAGLTRNSKAGPVWTGETRFNEKVLLDPIRWRRPRRIFVCAHGDLFHDSVPFAWIERVFAVMAMAPQHTFQVLTKRASRMHEFMTFGMRQGFIFAAAKEVADRPLNVEWPLPNVWLGVSTEDQRRADERVHHLLATPAAVRWISAEPLLGPIDLLAIGGQTSSPIGFDALLGRKFHFDDGGQWTVSPKINWVVAGGESGPGARPMHPDWARGLRDQCDAAGVAFHFKQWGAWAPDDAFTHLPKSDDAIHEWLADDNETITGRSWRYGKGAAGRHLDGQLHDSYPA